MKSRSGSKSSCRFGEPQSLCISARNPRRGSDVTIDDYRQQYSNYRNRHADTQTRRLSTVLQWTRRRSYWGILRHDPSAPRDCLDCSNRSELSQKTSRKKRYAYRDCFDTFWDKNNGQSHLAVGGIAANMLFGGMGSRMVSVMVPLDRVLLSSYRLFILTISLSLTVWLQFSVQILTVGYDPQIPFLWEIGVSV